MSVYSRLVRPALFRVGHGDPEIAHHRTVSALARVSAMPPLLAALRRYYAIDAPRTVFGIRFPNVVGLAAGIDKDGAALRGWPALGFGHVEVGTVTWHQQPGNPKPRLYRLPASGALINRMGFNNLGARALALRLAALGPLPVPLGVSIGKSKVTPLAEAVEDYRSSLRALYPFADYFAINVSSPNTPGLRGLQDRAMLDELVGALQLECASLAGPMRRPLLVKIAPDLTDQAIAEVVEVCLAHRVAGVIATNTTLSRDGLAPVDQALAVESGGLSGRPLAARARDVVEFVHRESAAALPVIGVGGISTVDDGLRLVDAGASLLQIFTGFIYSGPNLLRQLNRAVANRER
ncbi:MAG TPA: quinone-dependent dihydroorotate dehydrogenase [Pseudonocardiaceae bacterium]|jgi:dihydroorotate dehydrogenase|nr:quinone-dependent dihydroorotate dehydrogenase [Pseudonocardiaceae bacterium]